MKSRNQALRSLLFPAAAAALLLLARPAWSEAEVHVQPAASPAFPELPAAVPLWAGRPPGHALPASAPRTRWESYAHAGGTTWYAVMTAINTPAILPFLPPAAAAPTAAVVVVPGGGHRFLAMSHEGYTVGRWLSGHGVAAFVLEYRLSRGEGAPYTMADSLLDAQRAIRTVRSRAAEWRVNPRAVGIMGFSAGGEVAALAAEAQPPEGRPSDAVDAASCRPDFQAIFYPLLPRDPPPFAGEPPAFLCAATDDGLGLTPGLVGYYGRLVEAGVPAEMHIYATGGHGFGVREENRAVYSWMPLFAAWLGEEGFAPAGAPGAARP
jgi:acetyl esterase/lipase